MKLIVATFFAAVASIAAVSAGDCNGGGCSKDKKDCKETSISTSSSKTEDGGCEGGGCKK